jgi:membrane protein required for colicin V production
VTIFDYAVIGIIGTSFFLGLWHGILAEVLALAAWAVVLIAARAWDVDIAAYFPESATRYYAVAMIVALLIVLVILAVAHLVFSGILKVLGLATVSRLLGAVLGILRGVLIVLAGVLIGGMTTLPKSQWWRDAWLAPPCETVVIAVKPWLPAEVAKRIQYR